MKRSYKDIVESLDKKMGEYNVHIIYINNHLGNLDSHLEKINGTNLEQEVKIIRNKDRIHLISWIGGTLLTIFITGAIAGVLQLLGIIKLGIF